MLLKVEKPRLGRLGREEGAIEDRRVEGNLEEDPGREKREGRKRSKICNNCV